MGLNMGFFEMAPAIVVPMIVFTFVAVIVIVPMTLRAQERARMHATLRRLHEDGQPITPELLAALRVKDDPIKGVSLDYGPYGELRRGMILIAVALGLVILGLVIDAGDSDYSPIWPLIGVAAFPGLIGVASLIMWRIRLKVGADV